MPQLLYGSLHLQAFDWVASGNHREGGDARVVTACTLDGPAVTSVLLPQAGNIHSLKAVTDCAVLDVLAPPYSPRHGRCCQYYSLASDMTQSKTNISHGSVVRLVPIPQPLDFSVATSDQDCTSIWPQS